MTTSTSSTLSRETFQGGAPRPFAPPLTNIVLGYMGTVSLGPTGYATTTWTVPPTIPRGQPFAIQAVELKANGSFETTMPGITLRQ